MIVCILYFNSQPLLRMATRPVLVFILDYSILPDIVKQRIHVYPAPRKWHLPEELIPYIS
jgi:hypothetical protein